MKRFLALLLALCMMLCVFAGCGNTASEAPESASAPVEEAPVAEAPVEEASVAEEPSVVEEPVEPEPVVIEYPLCDPGEVELDV